MLELEIELLLHIHLFCKSTIKSVRYTCGYVIVCYKFNCEFAYFLYEDRNLFCYKEITLLSHRNPTPLIRQCQLALHFYFYFKQWLILVLISIGILAM